MTKLITKQWCSLSDLMKLADVDRNITIPFRYDILDTYTFKYYDNRVHNQYGRKGKQYIN